MIIKEHRFKIVATEEQHIELDKFFKVILETVMNLSLIESEYYTWEKIGEEIEWNTKLQKV